MLDSSEPIDANDPTENADAAEPMLPIEKNDPTDPMENAELTDPIEQNESLDHRLNLPRASFTSASHRVVGQLLAEPLVVTRAEVR
jgi:hypothetical protein